MSAAQSNLPEEGDGRKVWTQRVHPARVDPEKVAEFQAKQKVTLAEGEAQQARVKAKGDADAIRTGARDRVTGRQGAVVRLRERDAVRLNRGR